MSIFALQANKPPQEFFILTHVFEVATAVNMFLVLLAAAMPMVVDTVWARLGRVRLLLLASWCVVSGAAVVTLTTEFVNQIVHPPDVTRVALVASSSLAIVSAVVQYSCERERASLKRCELRLHHHASLLTQGVVNDDDLAFAL